MAKATGNANEMVSNEPGTDVSVTPRLSDDQLRGISSFDDAFKAASLVTLDGAVVDASQEIGNGFAILPSDDKDKLCGRELLFVEWDFHESDTVTREDGTPKEFVSVRVVTRAGKNDVEKYVMNDGSTGIYAQLRTYTDKTGRLGGLYARRGLRVSHYSYAGGEAETYYIDTSA